MVQSVKKMAPGRAPDAIKQFLSPTVSAASTAPLVFAERRAAVAGHLTAIGIAFVALALDRVALNLVGGDEARPQAPADRLNHGFKRIPLGRIRRAGRRDRALANAFSGGGCCRLCHGSGKHRPGNRNRLHEYLSLEQSQISETRAEAMRRPGAGQQPTQGGQALTLRFSSRSA